MRQILIFSDLDGTLLDHHSYSYQAALPALERIRRQEIPLILCTSKTAAELEVLRRDLDNRHPCIVENGAAILFPKNYFSPAAGAEFAPAEQGLTAHFFGRNYMELVKIVQGLRTEKGYKFSGFADFSVADVARETGLAPESALLAKSREGSEPIRWNDSPQALERFIDDLAGQQLQLIKGGRFYHVLPRVDKGQAVRWLCQKFRKIKPQAELFTIALGDGLNDLPMLEAVDLAVVLPSAAGDRVEPGGIRTLRMEEPGPLGWNTAINQVLDELQP